MVRMAARVLSSFLTVALGVVALAALLTRAQGGGIPMVLGYSPLIVVSGSMSPAVEAGDLIVIGRRDAYRPGDVVTFRDGGSLVTHRLVTLEDGMAVTRGDANNTEDKPFPVSDIVGGMALRVPGLGSTALFLRSRQGILLLLCAGMLALLGSHAMHRRKGDDVEKMEEHA
ncbi:MAG TPA: signal peptidase I [Candidatus Limnocylindria bacterium]|nr:signal peptidase I [Candidatus Limnocylindria bacterium]